MTGAFRDSVLVRLRQVDPYDVVVATVVPLRPELAIAIHLLTEDIKLLPETQPLHPSLPCLVTFFLHRPDRSVDLPRDVGSELLKIPLNGADTDTELVRDVLLRPVLHHSHVKHLFPSLPFLLVLLDAFEIAVDSAIFGSFLTL